MKSPFPASNPQRLVKLFLQHKLTLALAASCTCGLAPADESQQTTNEMALGLRKHLPQADVAVAATGLCGPGTSATPEKPVGTVFVTVLLDGHAHEYRGQLAGSGEKRRAPAVDFIYQSLSELLARREETAPQSKV